MVKILKWAAKPEPVPMHLAMHPITNCRLFTVPITEVVAKSAEAQCQIPFA